MNRSASAIVVIGLTLLSVCGSAEERAASSSQRYRVHVPKQAKFGTMQPVQAHNPADDKRDTAALVFMAETTTGVTIQFESQPGGANQVPLKLTVGGSQKGNWWASAANAATGRTNTVEAEASSVQASTRSPGWSTLKLDVTELPADSDEVTTIVVTIIAH